MQLLRIGEFGRGESMCDLSNGFDAAGGRPAATQAGDRAGRGKFLGADDLQAVCGFVVEVAGNLAPVVCRA